MRRDISLYGERASRFEELRDLLEEHLGYRPSRPEAVGLIMAEFPEQKYR